jgi:two-component sensor histidine kinase
MKYAFPVHGQGNIYISFTRSSHENRILLAVRDDGIGLPAGFNSSDRVSMGMNLMKGLSEDIDGDFAIESNNGTVVTVSFMYNPDISADLAPSVASQNFI